MMRGGYAADAASLVPLVTAAVAAGDVVTVKGSAGSKMGQVVGALRALDAQAPGAAQGQAASLCLPGGPRRPARILHPRTQIGARGAAGLSVGAAGAGMGAVVLSQAATPAVLGRVISGVASGAGRAAGGRCELGDDVSPQAKGAVLGVVGWAGGWGSSGGVG